MTIEATFEKVTRAGEAGTAHSTTYRIYMATMKYMIWSTYPPALADSGKGYKQVQAGTITKLTVNGLEIPPAQPLPVNTSLAQFEWQTPEVKTFQPEIKRVAGSKGKTYIVKSTPSGKWECSCTGYAFRRTCKHI